MASLGMTATEREQFLTAVHVGVLSVERTDGPPLAAPVWYRYEPGGAVEFITGSHSVKARLLTAAGRAALCAQSEALPYAFVTVDGPVTMGDVSDADRVELAVRYLGDELGRAYAASTANEVETLVRLTPQRWFTADFAEVDLGG